MSSLDTNLNAAPYNDDYSEDKNFHRVLFRPSVAVQARELTQLQTILQKQIERFGNHVFKDGSVVQGCSIEYIPDLEFVGVEDQFNDDSDLSLDDERLIGAIAVGQTSDVQALVVSTRSGFIRQNPGCLFLRYNKPGANNQRTFLPGEEIALYGEETSYVENIVLTVNDAAPFSAYTTLSVSATENGNTANVTARAIVNAVDANTNTVTVNNVRRRFSVGDVLMVDANNSVTSTITNVSYELSNEIGRINTLTANTDGIAISANDISGFAYGAHVSDGIVYHKGNFIRVAAHNVIVNEKSNDPAGYLLGFETAEEIVTETMDESLNDNALGYSNFNAPGAHRLKLTSTVVAKAANTVANTDVFFPIVEFSNTGVAFERTDPEYAALGDAIAQRTYEESGHYIIKPFGVSSNTNPADDTALIYDVSPGLAYVKGRRTELLTNLPVVGRRGTDTLSYSEQIVSMNYGNYIEVNEFRGLFANNGMSVDLRNAVQGAVSSSKDNSSAIVGTKIGDANVQEVVHVSGTRGSANAVYRMYLYNIRMVNNSVSFANVRSVTASGNNFSDVVLQSNAAVLQESSYAPLVFDLGAPAVKTLKDANNVADSNFYYTSANNSATLASAGTINFKVPSGGGILGFSDASDASEDKVSVILAANALSSNLTTAAVLSSSGNTVAATGLGSLVYPGEAIRHGANTYTVVATIDANTVQVANAVVNATAQTIQRFHFAGSNVPLDGVNRTITINANNEATVDLGITYTNAPVAATVRMYTLQNQGAEIKKEVKRSSVALITADASGTDRGPWNLGVPDVFRIRGVYITANTGNNITADLSTNYMAEFELDDGQRDTIYDHASLTLKSEIDAAQVANTVYLVEFDHFVANNTTGKGFFSVDSYPVDDSYDANTATTIKTAEIPTYYSSARAKTFDLRSVIDFRPYKAATATITSNLRQATLDPATTTSFDAKTTGFKPYPGQNFECNFTHYLGRKDVLTISPAGNFIIVEGVAGLVPRTPKYPAESLAIADIDVPAFPSLTDNERAELGRNDNSIKIAVQNHKRFTMKDISALEQRIQRLEYYTSLNALEKSAADMKVIGSGGLDRFKNGIFVDPLNDHSFGRVDVPQYKVAIDSKNGFARPFFQPEFFDLDYDANTSVGTVQTGKVVTMQYTEEAFITQDFATDSRKLSGAPHSYTGTLQLNPQRWSDVEVLAAPVSVNATDKASVAIRAMEVPPLCADYGWWRTDKAFSDRETLIAETSPTVSLRDKVNLSAENTYSIDDNTHKSITVQPYIRAREISFRAYGLKPYTRYYAFIDDVDATDYFAPGDKVAGAADLQVKRTDMWGTELESNSRGEIYGKISIPALRFKAGRHTVKLTSVDTDASTYEQVSSAAALFEAEVIYKDPPPPVVVPAPKPVPTPVAPIAKFKMTGSLYATAPANHSITFTDASTPGTGTITTWLWTFGDGTTYNGKTPPAHVFTMTKSTQSFTVSLKVTDSNGKTATYTQAISLYKLQPAPPVPSPNTVVHIASYSNGSPTGSGSATGAGSCESTHVATPSANAVGAFFEWAFPVNSGVPLTSIAVTSGGYANNTLKLTLVDPTPNTTPLNSTLSLTATYKYSNGQVLGTTTIPFSMNTTNVVNTAPTSNTVFKPVGGGGCVGADQWLDEYVQAMNVKVGMMFKTVVPGGQPEMTAVEDREESFFREGVRLVTESGAALRVSALTPVNTWDALTDLDEQTSKKASEMLGQMILVERNGEFKWERVVEVQELGLIEVVPISFGGRSFGAGETPEARIYTHNENAANLRARKF